MEVKLRTWQVPLGDEGVTRFGVSLELLTPRADYAQQFAQALRTLIAADLPISKPPKLDMALVPQEDAPAPAQAMGFSK